MSNLIKLKLQTSHIFRGFEQLYTFIGWRVELCYMLDKIAKNLFFQDCKGKLYF